MACEDTSKELPFPSWGSDSAYDYPSLLDEAVESLEIASPTSTENGSQKFDSPPEAGATKPVCKSRKRGRPRLIRDDRREADLKERRKDQLRLAQRAYRSRKEDQITMLNKKVADLEQKLFLLRNLYLNTCATSMNSDVLREWPTNSKSPQDSLELLTPNSGIDEASIAAYGGHAKSIPSIPVGESYPLFEMNNPLRPEMSPIGLLDMPYLLFNDNNYVGGTPAWRVRYSDHSNDIQNNADYLLGLPM
ncbi:hypothetical protein TSTA_071810 [Talaromyces stipitatus ATCC 10500]|uniref:BZIP domain-containing protein n=1 Tax=Talaromyces stipitatus (strain ATCC 10500 / CBS 375.48 / QM 6759 / NRRL 1006) TaxID=441959 RepID=B8LTV5_TALSN|nr:uncharacterized protein TSTA_071810 [Talaromyces stipitatus ATCC 10500]EED23785.1 hypothetical protein TSTA_071810 [Talaromyces stipitatus ATCC 10500]